MTGDFFEVPGVGAEQGRTLAPADDVPEAPRVAVLSQRLWLRKSGGDAGGLGQ